MYPSGYSHSVLWAVQYTLNTEPSVCGNGMIYRHQHMEDGATSPLYPYMLRSCRDCDSATNFESSEMIVRLVVLVVVLPKDASIPADGAGCGALWGSDHSARGNRPEKGYSDAHPTSRPSAYSGKLPQWNQVIGWADGDQTKGIPFWTSRPDLLFNYW